MGRGEEGEAMRCKGEKKRRWRAAPKGEGVVYRLESIHPTSVAKESSADYQRKYEGGGLAYISPSG